MKNLISSACLIVVLSGSLPAFAQGRETYSERPSKRQEKVLQAHERAERNKKEAREWAKARGLKMRYDDGKSVSELMAIRNGRPLYYTTDNDDAAMSTAADRVRNATPYNVNGSGITVGVWDAGSALSTHQEFGSRAANKNSVSSHYHSTHVGGTIGASGIVSRAEGMAPGAMIDSYDWGNDESEMAAAGASYAGEAGKIPLSNHSYGIVAGWRSGSYSGSSGWHFFGDWSVDAEPDFGRYDFSAMEWDEIVYDAPYYLPFKSAGNDRNDGPPSDGSTVYYYDSGWHSIIYTNAVHPKGDGQYKSGFDTISTKGTAKNIMTVGAIDDAENGSVRRLTAPYAAMATFSGWGPTDDGRIKPDIVANGVGLYSCDDDHNSDYLSISGTSMSSPNACGSAALLVDYYDDLFPGEAMRASTLKGLIIHTADDLGRPGPDYSYGWGLMNTLAAADHLKDYADGVSIKLTEATVTTSQRSDTYLFQWNGIDPIRVTLCWTDPEGPVQSGHDSTTSVLENDLDLKITGPGGTYYPYSLNRAVPTANATATGENNVDNVEQVYIATPLAGMYTITVDYDGSLDAGTAQWYSLLVSGETGGDTDDDGMPDSWEMMYFSSSTGAVATADLDNDGSDNLTEYISGTLPNNAGSVFKVTSFSAPPSNGTPFIINWNTVAGRLYSVGYSDNLAHTDFTAFSNASNLPYTQNSYTDSVERAGSVHLYRVDVKLEQ